MSVDELREQSGSNLPHGAPLVAATPEADRAYTLWAAWLTHTAQEGTAHE